jgi:hypothetical protein
MYEALIIVRRLHSHFTVQIARNNSWGTTELGGGGGFVKFLFVVGI